MVTNTEPEAGEVTQLLRRASAGDTSAGNDLIHIIGAELRRIAAIHMSRERQNHTLQATALMHESMMRLLGKSSLEWQSRQHFLSTASRVMRNVLVDYARRPNAPQISLELANPTIEPLSPQLLDIHQALEDLATIAPRQAHLVELRFFGGLTLEEAAEVLEISPRMADKDWPLARAWLRRRLGERTD